MPVDNVVAREPVSIAFVVDRFGSRYGGAEAYGVELMRELAASGHHIHVFARAYDQDCDLKLPFTRIQIANYWPSWVRVLLFAIKAARLTRNKYDIVHSHMNGWCGDIEVIHVTPVRYRWIIKTKSWFKRITYFISPRVQTYLALESRRTAAYPGHTIVAVSKLIAEQLHQSYNLDNIPVIVPGVAPSNLIDASAKDTLRQQLGLPQDATICLLVARNPMRKGLPAVLKAMEYLADNVHLLVVGANAASKKLLAQQNQAIQGRSHFISETSEVQPYYQASDIYIHPTLNDSFGMAPLEAMSYGLPVILSPAPWCGFAEYVQPDVEALVLKDPKDHQELASAIKNIIASPDLRAGLIAGAKQVVTRHSWGAVAQQYQDLYYRSLAAKDQTQPRSQ